MKTFRNNLALCVALTVLIVCSSWGFLMHRTITQLSIYQLPKEMQPFFSQNMDYLIKNSVRPDERRNSDRTEATKHFIDLEAYGENAEKNMPTKWDAAVAMYTKDTLLKYGHVPYWIIEMKARLANAFDKEDRDSILFYAADIAHYIEDANVPLHTTLNYDGQLSGQKGIHALWESVVPELTLQDYDLEGKKKAKYLKNPEEAIWKAIRHTNSLVREVLDAEKEVTKDFTEETKYRIQKRNGRDVKYYTRNFALAYSKKLGSTINDQAVRAADLVADFWYTAWVDGGKPDLSKVLTRKPDTAAEKKISDEIKAYRKNELLKKGWLVAKKDAVADGGEN
ncbi:MAG: hypothetical protein JWR72_2076 [Flavisolibacter sp.]|jgi:hypothetical protein|nr:hypothetical protein [Flavisolibacter sp.]